MVSDRLIPTVSDAPQTVGAIVGLRPRATMAAATEIQTVLVNRLGLPTREG